MKYDMLIMKAWVSKECKPENGPCKVTSLQWCLQRIVETSHFYPRLSFTAEAFLVVTVCNAWPVKPVVLRLKSKTNIKTTKSKH